MSRWWRRAAIAVLIGVLGWAVAVQTGLLDRGPEPLALRSKATAFRLPVLGERGRSMALSDMAGKGVLLNFWAPACEPCTVESALLGRLQDRYGGLHFTVLSVTDARKREVLRFLEQAPVKYPVLHDKRGEVRARYRAEVLPFSVFVAPDGRVAGAVAGLLDEDDAVGAVERLIVQARQLQRAGAKPAEVAD